MAVNYKYVSDEIGFPDLNVASDLTQRTSLGRTVVGKDISAGDYGEGEAIYVKFTGAVALGDFVAVDRFNKTAVQLPGAAPGANKVTIVGIALQTQVINSYGWVLIRGVHDAANVTAALTVGTVLSGSAIAGRVNQAVATYILDGSVLRAAGVAGAGTVELYWPICSGR